MSTDQAHQLVSTVARSLGMTAIDRTAVKNYSLSSQREALKRAESRFEAAQHGTLVKRLGLSLEQIAALWPDELADQRLEIEEELASHTEQAYLLASLASRPADIGTTLTKMRSKLAKHLSVTKVPLDPTDRARATGKRIGRIAVMHAIKDCDPKQPDDTLKHLNAKVAFSRQMVAQLQRHQQVLRDPQAAVSELKSADVALRVQRSAHALVATAWTDAMTMPFQDSTDSPITAAELFPGVGPSVVADRALALCLNHCRAPKAAFALSE